jgi:hypothetical protein
MPKSEIQKRSKSIAVTRRSIKTMARLHWNPGKLEIPRVPEDLQSLDPIGRGAETLRYSTLRLEYWLSPNGLLREWLRWNLAAGLSLSIPAIIVVPVATYLLTQFATWTALLMQIVKNLLVFPILALVILALVTGIGIIGKTLMIGRK